VKSNDKKDSIHAEVGLWDYFVDNGMNIPQQIFNWRTTKWGEERFNASPCSRCQEDSCRYGTEETIVYLFDEGVGWKGKRMCDYETSPSSGNREWNKTCCVSQ